MTDMESMFVGAVRYALTRHTYIVGKTVEFMMKQPLSYTTRQVMIRDIENHLKSVDDESYKGIKAVVGEWRELLHHLTTQ